MKLGFDSEKYLEEQSQAILERAGKFDDKLYLEFGGKLICDFHAARILPGFDPNAKIKLLQKLKDKVDIVICIYAGDIEQKKMRADFGLSYDTDTMRTIDDLRDWGLDVKAVVVTRYQNQPAVRTFMNKLSRRGIKVYTHRPIEGYPTEVETIVSSRGYGANAYIETDRPIVVVTGPGPNSGKMATCLSQVYHEFQRGIRAGYAKFETFPVWNLPLNHPVNIAYEAATADLADVNMVDPFHLEAYGETVVNYNRDVEIFPVVKRICARIMDPEQLYRSPTDMGVNRVGFAITDDEVVRQASIQEIIRRYFRYMCDYATGAADKGAIDRVKLLMDDLGVTELDRRVVAPAREAAKAAEKQPDKGSDNIYCGAALELPDGRIICQLRLEGEAYFSVWQSESSDGGRTWTPAVRIAPGSPPHLMLHSSGVLISSYGCRRGGFGQRVMFSRDGGRSWDIDWILRDDGPAGDLGYPSTVELSDGSLYTVYYQQPAPGAQCAVLASRWRVPEA